MMKMQGDNLFIYLFQWKWGSYVYFPDVICLLSAILDMFYAFLTLAPPCFFLIPPLPLWVIKQTS